MAFVQNHAVERAKVRIARIHVDRRQLRATSEGRRGNVAHARAQRHVGQSRAIPERTVFEARDAGWDRHPAQAVAQNEGVRLNGHDPVRYCVASVQSRRIFHQRCLVLVEQHPVHVGVRRVSRRHRDGRQVVAIDEHLRPEARHAGRNRHVGQVEAVSEPRRPDVGHAVRDRHAAQVVACRESTLSNAGHVPWNRVTPAHPGRILHQRRPALVE